MIEASALNYIGEERAYTIMAVKRQMPIDLLDKLSLKVEESSKNRHHKTICSAFRAAILRRKIVPRKAKPVQPAQN